MIDRANLIHLGIGRRYVDALIDAMKQDFAGSVGVSFARACNAKDVVTDDKAAERITQGKGCPSSPQVAADGAYLAEAAEMAAELALYQVKPLLVFVPCVRVPYEVICSRTMRAKQCQ